MIEILIKYSAYCEKTNPHQILSALCDCIKWLDDIPNGYQPTVPIYHCQQEREKMYAGAVDTHNFARIQTLKEPQLSVSSLSSDEDPSNGSIAKKTGNRVSFKPNQEQVHSQVTRPLENNRLSAPTHSAVGRRAKRHGLESSPNTTLLPTTSTEREKLRDLFVFANKCLQCISVYVSYHDIQSTLSRAILPRLSKARSFWHKKYLIHAAMETALQQRKLINSGSNTVSRSPLTVGILRYILQCPFLNNDSANETHRDELIDLTQLLLHNLALRPRKKLKSSVKDSFMMNVLEFESLITRHSGLRAKEKPNLSALGQQSKRWIYSVIFEELSNIQGATVGAKPVFVLRSFATTINIIFHAAPTLDDLADDFKTISTLLIELQKYAHSLDHNAAEISYGCLIHTWCLSVLFLLARCFNQSSPDTQELISRLKDIKQQRELSHQMWSHFVIDHFGLIETAQSVKEKLTLQKTIRDEVSIRGPDLFGPHSTVGLSGRELSPSLIDSEMGDIGGDADGDGDRHGLKSDDDGAITDHCDSPSADDIGRVMDTPPLLNPKSKSLPPEPSPKELAQRPSDVVDRVTHLIPFEVLLPIIAKCLGVDVDGGERGKWIADASKRYVHEPDFKDLFKSRDPTDFADNQSATESADYAPSITQELDQRSIPSEVLWPGLDFDIFRANTIGRGGNASFKDLFDEDADKRELWKRNHLIKQRLDKKSDFYDVVEVYDAQTDHGERANAVFFDHLYRKMGTELEVEAIQNGISWRSHTERDRDRGDRWDRVGRRRKGDDDGERSAERDHQYQISGHSHGITGFIGNVAASDDEEDNSPPRTHVPSLLQFGYKSQSDMTGNLQWSAASLSPHSSPMQQQMMMESDDFRYLLIDQQVLNQLNVQEMREWKELMTTSASQSRFTYRGVTGAMGTNQILTPDFEYRLGLRHFEVEKDILEPVEFELDGLNMNYVDPNDFLDGMTASNWYHGGAHGGYHHHFPHWYHHHQHHFYHDADADSDISEDSESDHVRKRDNSYSQWKRAERKKRDRLRKREKEQNRERKRKEFERKFKAFGKGIGKGIRGKLNKMQAPRRRAHEAADSNEMNLGVGAAAGRHHDAVPSDMMLRQQSTPPMAPTSVMGVEMAPLDVIKASLTDGDEPLESPKAVQLSPVTAAAAAKKQKIHKNSQVLKRHYLQSVPSESATPNDTASYLATGARGDGGANFKNIQKSHHRQVSSGSMSDSIQSRDSMPRGIMGQTINEIEEEEEAEYQYTSD